MNDPLYRKIIIRQLDCGQWVFSWGDNTRDSLVNEHLPPFDTPQDATTNAYAFIERQNRPEEWEVINPEEQH